MLEIPEQYKDCSIVLSGCRALGINYDCCEYNLVVFNDSKELSIVIDDDKCIEVHKLSNDKLKRGMQLYNSKVIQDPRWIIQNMIDSIDYNKIFRYYARIMLINSMIDANNAKRYNDRSPLLLKRSAYYYLLYLLLANNIRPSPSHLFAQLRSLDIDLSLAFEALSINRVSSSSILRAYNMLSKLNIANFRFVSKKLFHLYESNKLIDSSLYLISLAFRYYKYFNGHDLAILFDLNRDQSMVTRLAEQLFNTSKEILKNNYHSLYY